MEDNWKEKIRDELNNKYTFQNKTLEKLILNLMERVFEATKKECANKAKMSGYDNFNDKLEHFVDDEYTIFDKDNEELIYVQINIDKESILNIEKPNI